MHTLRGCLYGRWDDTFAGTGRFLSRLQKLFIWEAGRDVCREGTLFIPALKTVYMGGGTVRLSGRDAFHPGFT